MLKLLKLPKKSHLPKAKLNIFSLAIIGLLLFIPLYPKFPIFNVKATWVAIRIEDFLVGGVVLVWFLSQWRQGFPALKDKVSRLILLYWGIGALALISSLLITKNINPQLALLHFLRRIEYMSLFFVALTSVKEAKNVRSYGLTIFLATLGVVIYGIGQKFFDFPVVSTMNKEFSKGTFLQLTEWARVNSTFAGHYDLAAYLVITIAVTTAFLIGLKNRWEKALAVLIGLSAYYLLILTGSRISFAAYLIAVTLVLLVLKKFKWLGPVLALSIVSMFLFSDIGERYALTLNLKLPSFIKNLRVSEIKEVEPEVVAEVPPEVKEEIEKVVEEPAVVSGPKKKAATPTAKVQEWRPTTELAVAYSNAIRFKVEWPRALRALAKNPFLGTGYSSVTLATDNDYLRSLAETGLFGSIAFGLIFLEITRRVIVFLQKPTSDFLRAIVVGISGATIGLLANAVFIDVFEASKIAFIFWILTGTLVGMMKLKPERAKL